MNKAGNNKLLEKEAKRLGAHYFGVAKIYRENLKVSGELENCIDDYPYAVSIGVNLSGDVVKTIKDAPTLIYSWHYRQVNSLLDMIALKIAHIVSERKYSALPVAASQVVDWRNQTAHLSHKHVAYLAGLGWLGRNNLIVNNTNGSAVRYVTILTNMPLKTDKPLKKGCGSCYMCIKACPAGAIAKKAEDFNHLKCYEKLAVFSKISGVKYHICGVCIKACSMNLAKNTH